MERNEIRGAVRAAYTALLRARVALLAGLEEQDCILTPRDSDEVYKTLKDMGIVFTDIKKACGLFASVSDARKAIHV